MNKKEITFGIQKCSECKYFLRCEECVYGKQGVSYIRKETAKEIIEQIKSLLYPDEGGLLAWLVAIADKYGIEVQE